MCIKLVRYQDYSEMHDQQHIYIYIYIYISLMYRILFHFDVCERGDDAAVAAFGCDNFQV